MNARLIQVTTPASPSCIYCASEGKQARSRFALHVGGESGFSVLYSCPTHLLALGLDLTRAAEAALDENRHATDCRRYLGMDAFRPGYCSCGVDP